MEGYELYRPQKTRKWTARQRCTEMHKFSFSRHVLKMFKHNMTDDCFFCFYFVLFLFLISDQSLPKFILFSKLKFNSKLYTSVASVSPPYVFTDHTAVSSTPYYFSSLAIIHYITVRHSMVKNYLLLAKLSTCVPAFCEQ